MATTTHTQGPWQFHKRGQRVYGGKVDGVMIAQVSINPQWEENGRLIAAAPEMLDALQLVVGSLDFNRDDSVSKEVLRRIELIIAKASA